MERIEYDEFGLFHENAAEAGLPYDGPPAVRRQDVEVEPGRKLSSLVWGTTPPELVLVHGGAQNAHTWDTVALALDRPVLAVDLAGHGHSDGPREARPGDPLPLAADSLADDVAAVVEALAPDARAVVGMSLGGMTALALSARHPRWVRKLVLVDVTPGVDKKKAGAITAFLDGPPTFPSFADILARTVEYNPTRSESSLRRGILHNAVQLEDGSWVWRHARFRRAEAGAEAGAAAGAGPGGEPGRPFFGDLWQAVSGVSVPLMLVRGMAAGSVVSDDDEAELLRRIPAARIERVEGAGHSVQGDRPLELARLVDDFVG